MGGNMRSRARPAVPPGSFLPRAEPQMLGETPTTGHPARVSADTDRPDSDPGSGPGDDPGSGGARGREDGTRSGAPPADPPTGSPEPGIPETATAIARAVAGDRVPATAVVERTFRRIRDRDPELRAFLAFREDEAMAEAEALDRRDDLDRLPLAGVPIAVKDNLHVKGLATTGGSEATARQPADRDAPTVARLRAAGAIVVGKTALPELGVWATTDGFWGVTRNPVDPGRTAGGSSGGSAAAVATGMVPVAVGTDGLGSVRIPAACCGIPGLKPGHGGPPAEIAGGDWYGLTVVGPLAGTVEDVKLAAAVMAGVDPGLARGSAQGTEGARDARGPGHAPGARSPRNTPGPRGPLSRELRIAVSTRHTLAVGSVDPEWAEATRAAAERLRELGHRIVEADPPYGALDALPAFSRWFAGTADAVDALVRPEDRSRLQRRTRAHARAGRWVRRVGGPRVRPRHRARRRYDRFLARYDAVLTPALAAPPIPADGWHERGWLANLRAGTRYAPMTGPWNLVAVPAGVVPVGTHSDGTPLAVQVVAGAGEDDRVLRVMGMLEEAFG